MVVFGAWYTLTGMYRYGFLNMGSRSIEHELNVYSWSLHDHFMNPMGSDVPGTIAMAAGAAVTVFLGAMRLRFWCWRLRRPILCHALPWGCLMTP